MEPAALASAYAELRPLLVKISEYVRDRLKSELHGHGETVLLESRVKAIQSVHQKLQTGRYASLRDVEDLAGVKVVVLRRREIATVAEIVESSLQLLEEKERVVEPSVFRYRERHLLVVPPADYLDRNPDLQGLRVEVQLTSVVQHALDQATHDFDYKGANVDWARLRLVAQLRAVLELVDNMLDGTEESAALMEKAVQFPPELRRQNEILVVMTGVFADDALPSDRRRLAETISALIYAAGIEVGELHDLLTRNADLLEATSITPLDCVIGVLMRERKDLLLGEYGARLLISDELRSLCVEASDVPGERLVSLSGDA